MRQMFVGAALLALAARGQALDWQDPKAIVAAALANHPTVARLEAEASAAREQVAPAASQPNPMLMAGVQNKPLDLSDAEMTMYMVGAQQTLVRGSKLEARSRVAELRADAAGQQAAAARAVIERDVLFAWYDAAAADSKLSVAEQVRELIGAIVDAARVRYEVGTSIQAEVIRAQLERSNLEHQVLSLRGTRNAALARLLPLVGLPPGTEIPRLALPRSTEALDIDGGLVASDRHPLVLALRSEIDAQEQQARLGRLLSKPDVTLEASYGNRPMGPDMFSFTANVELPIRRKSLIEPRIREAIARREAATAQLRELRLEIARGLAAVSAIHQQANEQLRFHEEVLVPQAKLAVESTLTSYQSGKSAFDAVLGAESTWFRLQLDYYDYLNQHIKAITDFEALRKGARTSLMASTALPAASSGGQSTTSTAASMSGM